MEVERLRKKVNQISGLQGSSAAEWPAWCHLLTAKTLFPPRRSWQPRGHPKQNGKTLLWHRLGASVIVSGCGSTACHHLIRLNATEYFTTPCLNTPGRKESAFLTSRSQTISQDYSLHTVQESWAVKWEISRVRWGRTVCHEWRYRM